MQSKFDMATRPRCQPSSSRHPWPLDLAASRRARVIHGRFRLQLAAQTVNILTLRRLTVAVAIAVTTLKQK